MTVIPGFSGKDLAFPLHILYQVVGLEVSVRHEIAFDIAVVVAGYSHTGVRHDNLIRVKVSCHRTCVGEVLVLGLRLEALFVRAFRTVAASVGVADIFNDPFLGMRRPEGTLRQ